ncbi:MAG TPA: PA2779 family protein [Burkholderiaceae bacterium]|nr:PA2779 family protein [Burkholderiaceae bacterium]
MNVRAYSLLRTLLVASSLLMTPMLAGAEIVSTDQLVAKSSTDAERARIQAFLDRANATGQLQSLGVKGIDAQTRISALSDEEVHELAARIDSLPAGGNFGGFTDQQIIIVVLLLILVAILVSA